MAMARMAIHDTSELKHLAEVFLDDEKDDQPPNRPGIDHAINLTKDKQGRENEVPWGPLYSMSRDELLVLRKTLSDHLDRNWIRASSSPGGAPVLFARKPGGGLRFCVDYRGINAITEKDRYPLPLISETLRALSKAKYFTKVDVRAAFHKIRIKEGDEWKTAFRTRFGLFEWLVTPFGLTGAPATFQRYINSTLQEYLDDFCSAYIDDVLIYTDGTYADHMEKVNLVIKKLGNAGLRLDIDKCEFAVFETKYLGFIIQAGKGVKVDPAKVAAIREWTPPTNVKGVRSFIGFANFYRQFIDSFSDVAAPLVRLTKKGTAWTWGPVEERAFETLKNLFITAPVLAMWDEDRKTIVECDCSGWALGGTLSQVDDEGELRPVAFFSKKLSPAEVNYEIHDKELLAVVKCLEEWRGELKSLGAPFKILTDHKNLQYFMTTRKLSERQVRWSQKLSEYDFQLEFRSGSKSGKPDALSRREQDIPQGEDDDRLKSRIMRLVKDHWVSPDAAVTMTPAHVTQPADRIPNGAQLFAQLHLQELWDTAKTKDSDIALMYQALASGERSFPPTISRKVTISIAECEFDERGALVYRHKLFVPDWEPLRTALIQKTHDSHVTGHPGRDGTLAILSREFFWPGISREVRQFCANCDVCGRSKVWRERKKGLLRPLPIPERPHSELGIDFMTELPARKTGDPRYLMVIVDRLTGAVSLEAMTTMAAEKCAERFVHCHWKHHGFPHALTSDRGSNWTSEFWTKLCELTGIEQRLSTAFHPETDGATERMNQEVLAYLRAFITYSQYDWPDLLPSAMLAINNRNTSTGMSPFFLTHGYHVSPIQQVIADQALHGVLEATDAEKFVQKLREGWELAQAAMATRQQEMEDQANRSRGAQERFEVGDLVWLKLKNISTPQLLKKLAWANAKYRVTKVVSPHVVELDVPTNIHPRFHVDLLKRAPNNPLPSQETDDAQPPHIEENDYGEPEFLVEQILRSRRRRIGRGFRRELLVKWVGYAEPDWRPRADFEETEALDAFEAKFGDDDDVGEPEAGADQLPPHRDIDHAINFVPDAKYPKAPLYDMTPLELQAVKKYLDGMLAKGFISSSSSPLASPILFARKPGSLRFCVDFRAVNDITIKDVTPLPRINESLRTAATGNIFTKLDLRAAYHLIRIKKDEYKTAFRTRYGIFEYNVMPFGLTNAPATCQKYVSEVLSEYLDIFCVCYLDDILVFSLNQEEHDVHVRKVLLKLAQASLFVKGEKCEFDKTETTFVGFVISADALKMDPAKVAAVREWEAPRTVKGVQSFLGFANFYRRFIRDFSRICTPLFELTKKTQSFVWSSECEAAFHTLKDLFCSEPILKHFDYLLDTVIETDASDRVISAVMSQYHPTDKGLLLHPVAYFSQKMNPAQCNYGVGDKELLAIVESLKSWRFMVESLEKPVLVLTDHRNLAVLKQIPAMNRRQARWAMELSEYRYVITYRPGSLNSRADALTRRYEDLVSSSSEEDKELCAPIIPPENFIGTMSLVDEVKIALSTDKWALDVISALRGQSTKPPDVDLSVCRLDNDGLLFVNDLLYLPNEDLRVRALKNCHDIMPSGHPGQKNTFELLVREYWWPGMRRDVIRYIRNCEVCQRIKSARHSPYGLLKPLTIPQARWTSVSLDFITGLPVSNSFDMILVVVDRLSKMAHFIPCDSSLDAAGFAKLYLSAVYRLHGLPLDIVSDRGSLFTSAFSKALAKLLGIKQNLSTAFHPQTDGQTERVNSILEQYLRGYTNYRQDNWADLLPLAEFSYNDSESSSTMLTPFFANHGFHPRSGRESLPVSVEKGPLRNFVKELDNICQFLKTEITWSRERMTEYANRHKSSAPLLREGDLVWLLSRNIRTTRPSKKLDFKKLGPFKILRKVSSHTYELALPATMKVHPVFHVCLLEPCASDPLPGQKNPPPPPVIVDGEEEFVVKEIIGVSSRGPLQYQVVWEGYEHDGPSWEPLDHLANAPEKVAEFYKRMPNARRS
ncbi:uncharacterized protein BROUX77_000097 [Berkeleyomyces rouxiae]|uniref:uncharacterized protein n=1 Tax=Berkeleyomyces rouxiae TaxID=2035830 RepID=UPI003B765063